MDGETVVRWISYEYPVSREQACGVKKMSAPNAVALAIQKSLTSTHIELRIPPERLIWHSYSRKETRV